MKKRKRRRGKRKKIESDFRPLTVNSSSSAVTTFSFFLKLHLDCSSSFSALSKMTTFYALDFHLLLYCPSKRPPPPPSTSSWNRIECSAVLSSNTKQKQESAIFFSLLNGTPNITQTEKQQIPSSHLLAALRCSSTLSSSSSCLVSVFFTGRA